MFKQQLHMVEDELDSELFVISKRAAVESKKDDVVKVALMSFWFRSLVEAQCDVTLTPASFVDVDSISPSASFFMEPFRKAMIAAYENLDPDDRNDAAWDGYWSRFHPYAMRGADLYDSVSMDGVKLSADMCEFMAAWGDDFEFVLAIIQNRSSTHC